MSWDDDTGAAIFASETDAYAAASPLFFDQRVVHYSSLTAGAVLFLEIAARWVLHEDGAGFSHLVVCDLISSASRSLELIAQRREEEGFRYMGMPVFILLPPKIEGDQRMLYEVTKGATYGTLTPDRVRLVVEAKRQALPYFQRRPTFEIEARRLLRRQAVVMRFDLHPVGEGRLGVRVRGGVLRHTAASFLDFGEEEFNE